MRLIRPALACAALFSGSMLTSASFAAPATAPASTPAAAPATSAAPVQQNPLIASVNGQEIRLDDVKRVAATLPPQVMRQYPTNQIVGLIVEQLVNQKALQVVAKKEGFDKHPDVAQAMQDAANSAMFNAYMRDKVMPMVTDAAIEKRYQEEYVAKKGETEIHARHILVKTEAEAKDVINQLNHGADFAKLAAKLSQDKGSGASGGDLGWFKKADMLPAFSDAAFKMKPNTISQTPVQTQYGWHVIQVLGSRVAPTPELKDVKDQIRQELTREDAQRIEAQLQSQVKIVRYDAQGKPLSATATPAAPQK
ncbi:peptidylprolyl isomerase [Brytella acorum]|uniref:Parvulin-like PPIase n=1 Tax=Brytella acorum TaxID=2959299 RepID=A0AA35UW31_9PROT|nr:peptidylprolyl isomerase [Brytella acorum]MDF3623843.1 peptidylprolyl isomerase [Brytella acorum]CAI9120759.1 peptidylprolyl isomerase [Brytella acorum]